MARVRNFSRLPGFRDFTPEDLGFRSQIFDAWRRLSRRYGFQEYDGPPLEPLELYVEKSGEEIVGQLYHFQDKGGRDISLRPEMTPSLARMLAERSRSLPKPIRWFSIPQLFRYERQQRGRLREHFQWNVDVVGEADSRADAEVLAVAIDGLRELGLTDSDFHARVSDRGLLTAILGAIGVPKGRIPNAFSAIDKVEREPPDRIRSRFRDEVGLEERDADRILELLEAPGLDSVEERFGGLDEVMARVGVMRDYLEDLGHLGMGQYVDFDLSIVRGLAYYTGIVFELFDRRGTLRAICGGGRYDRLLELVGGDPLPAVGFGMGDVVLGELLQERGLRGEYKREVDFYIVSFGREQRGLVLRIAQDLRGRGHGVSYALREQGVRKQLSAAAAEGAKRVILLGPDEVSRGRVRIRDMTSGEESEAELDRVGG
jgi:histidyl-tRNA synthetase